jgi:hypothetical protein
MKISKVHQTNYTTVRPKFELSFLASLRCGEQASKMTLLHEKGSFEKNSCTNMKSIRAGGSQFRTTDRIA